MKKKRGELVFAAACRAVRAMPVSEKKTRGWWSLFLSLVSVVIGVGVGISSASAATVGPAYMATVSSAYPVIPQVGTVFNGRIIKRVADGGIETVYDDTYSHDSMLAAWPDRGFPTVPPNYQSRFQGNPCWSYPGDPTHPYLVRVVGSAPGLNHIYILIWAATTEPDTEYPPVNLDTSNPDTGSPGCNDKGL